MAKASLPNEFSFRFICLRAYLKPSFVIPEDGLCCQCMPKHVCHFQFKYWPLFWLSLATPDFESISRHFVQIYGISSLSAMAGLLVSVFQKEIWRDYNYRYPLEIVISLIKQSVCCSNSIGYLEAVQLTCSVRQLTIRGDFPSPVWLRLHGLT